MNTFTREALGIAELPAIDQIINAYAKATGVRMDDLVGPSKASAITAYRHELMFLIRRLDPTASFTLIGRLIGGRDMATVHEAIAKVEQRRQQEPEYADQLVALARQVVLLGQEQASPVVPQAKPWQLLAAAQVLRDEQMTDAEARKVALSFIQQLEAAHG
jgi:hypothetical protein